MTDKTSKLTNESNEKIRSKNSSLKIQQVLESEDLVRKEISEGQDSLFKAFSDGLYFTPNYYQQIKDLCIRQLSDLITTNTLPSKLSIFRGNFMLWKDYSKNPSSPDFFSINIELFSIAYNVRVMVYTVTTDGFLTAKIFNNKFDKTIQFINSYGVHLDVVYSKDAMQTIGSCQHIATNIVNGVLEGTSDPKNFEWKDLPTIAEANESKTEATNKSKNSEETTERLCKRRNSDSSLDTCKTTDSDQLGYYKMFVDLKPSEELSSLIEKDLSKLGQPADQKLVPEPRLSAGERSTASERRSSLTLSHGRSFPNQKRTILPEEDNEEDLQVPDIAKLEKSKSSMDSNQNKFMAHFTNAAPPGLRQVQRRYSTKTFGSENIVQSLGDYQPRHRMSESGEHGLHSDLLQSFANPKTPNRSIPVSNFSDEGNKLQGNSENLEANHQIARNPNRKISTSEKKKPVIIEESQHRYTGRLKFFDEAKSYGFIVMDDDGSDIFVHLDDLQKANINKDFLKSAKFGNSVRLSFGCMDYIGKYNKSRKATDIQFLA